MPRELVGDAYVRIFADTKYMSKAIQDDLRKAGKGSAESFLADFDKTLRQSADARLKRSQTALADAITGGDFDAMLKRSGQSVDEFVRGIEADLRRLDTRKSVKFEGLQDALDALDQWAGTARLREEADRLAASLDDDWRAASRLNAEYERQVKIGSDLAAMYDSLDTKATRREMRDLTREIDGQNKAFEDLHAAALRINLDFDKAARKTADSGVSVHRTSRAIHALNDDLERFSIAGGVGRIFGQGSRNDFINFLGSAIGGMVGLGEAMVKLPFKVVEKFSDGLEDMLGHFGELRASGASLTKIITGGLSAGLKGALPAIAALVVGAGALSTILPAAVSAVSLALGGLTAIAGALTLAITGALLPLVPIAVALAAGIAPLIIGFTQLQKRADETNSAFSKLKKGWADLLKTITPFVNALGDQIVAFAEEDLGGVAKFIAAMGDQVITVIGTFRALFDMPEMKEFTKVWGDTIPLIFGEVGTGIANLIAALTAFFAPILPYAQKISAAFERMTQDFLGWTMSAEGQNSIASFMERAYDAAKALGQILVNVTVAIAKTFDIGTQSGGQSFLDYLVELTAKWREWVGSPEGQNTLREWFDQAREAGKKVFTIIGDVFKFFQDLDTETARKDLQTFLTSLESMGDSLATVAEAITTTEQVFDEFGSFLSGFTEANGDDLTVLIGYMEAFGEAVNTDFREGLSQMGAIFAQIGADLQTSYDQISGGLTSFWEFITTPPDLSSITGFITQPFTTAQFEVVGALIYLQQQIGTYLTGIPPLVLQWLSGLPAALLFPFQTGAALLLAELATLPGRIGTWLSQAPTTVRATLADIVNLLPEPFRTGAQQVIAALDRGIADIRGRLGGWASIAAGAVSGVIGALTSPFETALSRINEILGQITAAAARIPGVGAVADLLNGNRNAAGGIVLGTQWIAPGQIAGEAGREAIVPLDRPLSLIDPSVRALAAFAQGKSLDNANTSGGTTILPGAISVTVPNADPLAAAQAMLDRLASTLP